MKKKKKNLNHSTWTVFILFCLVRIFPTIKKWPDMDEFCSCLAKIYILIYIVQPNLVLLHILFIIYLYMHILLLFSKTHVFLLYYPSSHFFHIYLISFEFILLWRTKYLESNFLDLPCTCPTWIFPTLKRKREKSRELGEFLIWQQLFMLP